MKMNKYLLPVVALIFIIGVGIGGYKMGRTHGYNEGYGVGFRGAAPAPINRQIKIKLSDTNNNGEIDEVYLCFQNEHGVYDRSNLHRKGKSPIQLRYDACIGETPTYR